MNKQLIIWIIACLSFTACKKDCPNIPEDNSCKADLAKGLIAYYPFTGNTNDQSGNNLHATAVNGAYLTTDFLGRANMAAGFDGINDYMKVPGNEKMNADSITVSFQVMVNSVNRSQMGVSRIKFEGGASLIFTINVSLPTDNKWGMAVAKSTDDCTKLYSYGDATGVSEPGPIVPGRWYNIITTFGNGNEKIYVDGVLKGTATAAFNKLKRCADADLMIGGWWSGGIISIDGKIDEVRLYNRVLSDCEIAKLSETFKQ